MPRRSQRRSSDLAQKSAIEAPLAAFNGTLTQSDCWLQSAAKFDTLAIRHRGYLLLGGLRLVTSL
jgi:hypothetical protein